MKSEAQTKAEIMNKARELGVEERAKTIWTRHEDAIKGAKTEYERHHIAACCFAELHRLFGCVGPLIVDGVEILPAQPGYEDLIEMHQHRLLRK